MLSLLATLVVSALPASSAAVSTACPDPTPPASEAAFGECDPAAPLNLWYRMSRFAEAEPGGLAAGPARRAQTHRDVTSCEAAPVPAQFSPPQLPPVALFALPTLLPLQLPTHFDADARDLPARAIAPPERPPRA